MLTRLLVGFTMMAVCVVVHAAGVAAALRRVRPSVQQAQSFWRITGLLVLVAVWVVLLHLVEIAAWGMFYVFNDAMPDMQSAIYFSAVTYTTTGYGDMVLPPEWRLHGGIEALTGILMCGWSTGFFFAIVSRLHEPTRRT